MSLAHALTPEPAEDSPPPPPIRLDVPAELRGAVSDLSGKANQIFTSLGAMYCTDAMYDRSIEALLQLAESALEVRRLAIAAKAAGLERHQEDRS